MPHSAATVGARAIVYHKQSASARTRFLRLAHGGVCAIEPLPELVSVLDTDGSMDPTVVAHPAPVVGRLERWLGLPRGDLELENEFLARVDAPGGALSIYLVRCNSIDPPFNAAAGVGAEFIPLTEVRDLKPAEMELLQRAYQLIMG